MTSKKQSGFTLIELLLAMAFIAFLLLFSVGAIWQIMRLYAKGVAIGQINQSGRQVVESMSRSMRFASPVTSSNNRLCADGMTYVWNVEGQTKENKFLPLTGPQDLRLVTLSDPAANYCKDLSTEPIPRDKAKDIIPAGVGVYGLSVKRLGSSSSFWDISLLIGTAGQDNSPKTNSTSGKLECAPDNQFCAFGDFETSVYSSKME